MLVTTRQVCALQRAARLGSLRSQQASTLRMFVKVRTVNIPVSDEDRRLWFAVPKAQGQPPTQSRLSYGLSRG